MSKPPPHYEFLRMGTHVDKSSDKDIFASIMQTLLSNDRRPGKQNPDVVPEKLPREKINFLITRITPILLKEPTLLEMEPPIIICGDTHGQYADLLDIIENIGWPPQRRYLFMGDYVDRGDQSIELICLLYLLKLQYPEDFYILRGNHETSEINSHYGFKEDCLISYDLALWNAFQESFKCLPLVAVIGSKILCMHGGLSPALMTLKDIRRIPRPVDIPDEGLTCDILWSDPLPKEKHPKSCGFPPNKTRLTSVWFCQDAVNDFLKRNDLELIVRGHELVDSGYEFTADKKVLTIFTAPYYADHPNDAAVLSVDEMLRCQIRVFKFLKPAPPQMGKMLVDFQPGQEPWNEVTLRDRNQFE